MGAADNHPAGTERKVRRTHTEEVREQVRIALQAESGMSKAPGAGVRCWDHVVNRREVKQQSGMPGLVHHGRSFNSCGYSYESRLPL